MNQADLIKTLKRIGWLALLFGAAAVIISAIEQKDASQVQEVKIEIVPLADSTLLINDADIQLAIERSFGFQMAGAPIEALDVNRLERVLEDEDFILNADVYLGARNNLFIEVEQRKPELRIIDKNGLNYYLDKDGIKMKLSTHFSARVLVATGNIPPHDPKFMEKERSVLRDLMEINEKLGTDPFFHALIEQIHVSNRSEYILIPKVGKQKILLGRINGLDDKLERLKIFYKEAVPYVGWRKYKTINLKIKDQVIGEK